MNTGQSRQNIASAQATVPLSPSVHQCRELLLSAGFKLLTAIINFIEDFK
jgi:hypothetical protein